MVKCFLLFCAIVFVVVGICELIYIIRKFATYPGVHTYNYSVVFLKKGFAVNQLKFLWQKFKWQGSEFAETIIAITDYIDDEEIFNCEKLAIGKNILLSDINSLGECLQLYEENH